MVCYTTGDAFLRCGIEPTFKTPPAEEKMDKIFGANPSLPSIQGKNNILPIYKVGSRVMQNAIKLAFEGSWSGEAYLNNMLPIELFFDVANATGAGTGVSPYVCTMYNKTPKSLTFDYGFIPIDSGANVDARRITGAVMSTLRFNCNSKEVVNISYDGEYAGDERVSLPLAVAYDVSEYNVDDSSNPFVYYDGALLYDGASVGIVEQLNFTFNQSPEMIFGLGEREAQCVIGKMITIEGKFIVMANSMELLGRFYTGTTAGTAPDKANPAQVLRITFVNSDATKKIQLDFSSVAINNISTEFRLGESIKWDCDFMAGAVTATVIGTVDQTV